MLVETGLCMDVLPCLRFHKNQWGLFFYELSKYFKLIFIFSNCRESGIGIVSIENDQDSVLASISSPLSTLYSTKFLSITVSTRYYF